MIQFVRKSDADPMRVCQHKEVTYLTFPILEETGLVRHLFSTRKGGVSKGIYASMNLSYSRGDEKQAVDENFRRIAEVFDSSPERIVCSRQTHTINIRLVTESDCGKGTVKETDYEDVDGLITNIPDIILGTFYADCVPLYFVDTRKKAIGLAHSGWRGTVDRMGGPSICQACYEVSEDVAEAFREKAPKEWKYIIQKGKEEGKYQLDLQKANQLILINAGVPEVQIAVSDICTCCNSKIMFSHRASEGKRGNLGAFMELRKS